jgi:putative membrane protein
MIVVLGVVAATLAVGTAGVAAQPDLNEQDRTFLVRAHQGNLTEIQAGKLAEAKATVPEIRDIAAKLINDHTKMDENVTRVAEAAGVELPQAPSAEQQALLKDLAIQSSVGFNRSWLAAQIAAHRQSLANGAKEVAEGSSDEVKQLARDAKPIVQTHLRMLEEAEPS